MQIKVILRHKDLPYEVKGACEYDEVSHKFSEVTIEAGSPYVKDPFTRTNTTPKVKALKQKIGKKRKELYSLGIIDDDKFIKDHTFDSLNAAGTVILGRQLNALTAFKTDDGKTLKAAYAQSAEADSLDGGDELTPSANGEKDVAANVIFYGVPGCGKSHHINKLLKIDDPSGAIPRKYYKRILFHPEYTYNDFVGQTMPETDSNGRIVYKFVPGPFVEILSDAYNNPDSEYFLIIEEINRGNAPAIFGDLFQLLDRDDNGESEYGIYNKDILTVLNGKKASGAPYDEVRIPSNLTIYATMNTCDQNVFTMDTAFKRRWRMKRIVNDFENEEFKKSELASEKVINDITWQAFGAAVNDAIVKHCSDGSSIEDKQLGTYFVRLSEAGDPEAFAEKVMIYLWEDVVKYDKSRLFNIGKYGTLDRVIAGFINSENVFADHCEALSRLYSSPDA